MSGPYSSFAITPVAPRKKAVTWEGDSRAVVRDWDKATKLEVGILLEAVCLGEYPDRCEKLQEIGKDVHCIRLASQGEEYRIVWLAKVADQVIVLHAFHKKSRRGIKTPPQHIDLAKKRLKAVRNRLGLKT
jgi:phage-related protein